MGDKIKLSDYVAGFLWDRGVKHVFVVSGGASLHLIHSIKSIPEMHFICPQHEQAGAMAADGYARCTRGLGAAIATSGPGATNLITGVCCSFYDSVPVMMITGQVSTTRMRGDSGVRQIGFQETATVEMFRPITKYAAEILDPLSIRYELEKAYHYAITGRPGPVLIDIPDNIQREYVDPDLLKGYVPDITNRQKADYSSLIDEMMVMIEQSQRPVAVFGWGLHLAGAEAEALEFVRRIGLPVAPTWGAADMVPAADPLCIGTFGTHGTRYGNFSVQNADLIISLGSRLDTKSTGTPVTTFAREARKIYVDIDPAEIGKFDRFGLNIDLPVRADAKEFLKQALRKIPVRPENRFQPWLQRIADWKKSYPICSERDSQESVVNPYYLVKSISRHSRENDLIFIDTGCTVAWIMQAFDCKQGQRIFHDFNNTAMGWALPASIGACFANPGSPVTCITGDGSLQMNIQEMATVIRHQLPIRIILINNHGYSMIQQTQDQWLGSDYLASSVEGGLAFPNFIRIAEAYGFHVFNIDRNADVSDKLSELYSSTGPTFCNVEIDPGRRVIPQVKYGRPNEDPEPLLSRSEFLRNMIVQPLPVSQE